MTNGEKMQVMFPSAEIEEEKDGNDVWIAIDYWTNFTKDWWNTEYKEPTKNDLGVEVLDKIRAEIKSKIIKKPNLDFKRWERERNEAFLEILDIIDKYKGESEDKD